MNIKRPSPNHFDTSKYTEIIEKLYVNMSEIEFERLSEFVVPHILENYEGFRKIEKGPGFTSRAHIGLVIRKDGMSIS